MQFIIRMDIYAFKLTIDLKQYLVSLRMFETRFGFRKEV
uniref:Uncharacterized protein n=1 Tax=Arundo donax TaxID=35708 RepID=A0A0A9AJD9_ARUDO